MLATSFSFSKSFFFFNSLHAAAAFFSFSFFFKFLFLWKNFFLKLFEGIEFRFSGQGRIFLSLTFSLFPSNLLYIYFLFLAFEFYVKRPPKYLVILGYLFILINEVVKILLQSFMGWGGLPHVTPGYIPRSSTLTSFNSILRIASVSCLRGVKGWQLSGSQVGADSFGQQCLVYKLTWNLEFHYSLSPLFSMVSNSLETSSLIQNPPLYGWGAQ